MTANKVEIVTQSLNATGNGAAISIPFQSAGLPPEVSIVGTFGGTSAQVQFSINGTTWFNIGTALTADGIVTINRLARFVRAALTGGTGIAVTLTLAY